MCIFKINTTINCYGPCGCKLVEGIHSKQHLYSKYKTVNIMTFTFDLTTFLGLGEAFDVHFDDWAVVSRCPHVSYPVMTCFKELLSPIAISRSSSETWIWCYFCYWFNNFGTKFPETQRIFQLTFLTWTKWNLISPPILWILSWWFRSSLTSLNLWYHWWQHNRLKNS